MHNKQSLKIRQNETTVKKAIRKQNFPDPFFLNTYSFATYSSCQHGCAYCDGRSERYHLEGDFEHDITVRSNLPQILNNEIPKLREISPVHISSGITDVYQPIEEKLNLTRKSVEILANYSFPVSVLTKSSLILRDLDLFKIINEKNLFLLQMSITTLDDNIREIFEPNASSIEERLDTVKQFKDAGCPVGIFMMPLLPGITDTEENLIPLLNKLSELKVDFVMPGFLTLRPGRQKEFYIQIIKKHYPDLLQYYQRLYHKPLVSGSPSFEYRNRYKSKFTPLFKNLSIEAPHYLYKDKMPKYQELYLLLSHMKSIYRRNNIDITPLSEAAERYVNWAEEQKKFFNKKRSLHSGYIDEQLQFMITCNQFDDIIKNEKLSDFIRKVIIEDKVFDYLNLKFYK